MGDTGWGIVFVLGITVAVAVVLVVVIWQVFAVARAKTVAEITAASDDAYRTLAKQATAAQQTSAEQQERIATELAALRSRVTAIEQLLREVG